MVIFYQPNQLAWKYEKGVFYIDDKWSILQDHMDYKHNLL